MEPPAGGYEAADDKKEMFRELMRDPVCEGDEWDSPDGLVSPIRAPSPASTPTLQDSIRATS